MWRRRMETGISRAVCSLHLSRDLERERERDLPITRLEQQYTSACYAGVALP